jgi:hypothetical protein
VDNLSKGDRNLPSRPAGIRTILFAPDAFENVVNCAWRAWRSSKTLARRIRSVRAGGESEMDVRLYPMPMQKELPIWLTCIHKESFLKAGEMGVRASLPDESKG